MPRWCEDAGREDRCSYTRRSGTRSSECPPRCPCLGTQVASIDPKPLDLSPQTGRFRTSWWHVVNPISRSFRSFPNLDANSFSPFLPYCLSILLGTCMLLSALGRFMRSSRAVWLAGAGLSLYCFVIWLAGSRPSCGARSPTHWLVIRTGIGARTAGDRLVRGRTAKRAARSLAGYV